MKRYKTMTSGNKFVITRQEFVCRKVTCNYMYMRVLNIGGRWRQVV